MKKIYLLIAALIGLTIITSCNKDIQEKPQIEFGQESLTLSVDGTSASIGYRINNAPNDARLTFSNPASWLTINADAPSILEFSATANDSEDERIADITFSYPGADDCTFRVTQSGLDPELRIEISSINATEVYFSVFTRDPALTWIPMVTNKAYFETITSDDQLFEEDLEYFKYIAGLGDVSLAEFIEQIMETGSVEDISIKELAPSSDYVIYAYGITTDGVRTTDIVSAEFSTEAPYEGDITFEFEVEEIDYALSFDIIPSHTGVPYYYGVVSEDELQDWYQTYNTNDFKTAIQEGDINYTIQLLMDYELISSRGDYFDVYNNNSALIDGYYECKAATKYYIYAAKWDEDCNLVGEVSFYEHTTAEIGDSEISISLEVSDITQSSAKMKATPSNNDSYVVITEKSAVIEGLSDDEIFEHVMDHYDAFLSEYTYNGVKEKVYSYLSPGTDYTFLAFGYKAGTLTSGSITKYEFTTLESGAPEDCTFEIEVEAGSKEADVVITPSDKGHFYHWMAYHSEFTADEAKAYLRDVVIKEYYEGNFPAFASWELCIGDTKGEAYGLFPNTEYKIGVIIMDYHSGAFLSDMHFSEPFTTSEVEYADVDITIEFGPYYDLQELVDAGFSEFESKLDEADAILPTQAVIEGDYSEFYYAIYNRDLTDTEEYPDDLFYEDLYYGSTFMSTTFLVEYDKQMTMVAVALDKNYNYGKLFRKTFYLTREGAYDVSGYNPAPAYSLIVEENEALSRGFISYETARDRDVKNPDREFSSVRESVSAPEVKSISFKPLPVQGKADARRYTTL